MFKIKRVVEPKFAQGNRYELWQLVGDDWILKSDKEPSLFTAQLAMMRLIPESELLYDDRGQPVK